MRRDPFASTVTENIGGALLIAGSVLLRPLVLRPMRRWGATLDELRADLPGDEVVPAPQYEITQAITIDAPPTEVFPWLAQIGHGRGGLYSYEKLENLAGCEIHNASRIVPGLQRLAVGDVIRFGPEGYPAMTVGRLEAPHTLVLVTPPNPTGAACVSSFVLRAEGTRSTRLISRYRGSHARTLGQTVLWRGITEPINAVMARKMLLGIKIRAETRAS
jgi:hypothetical protein